MEERTLKMMKGDCKNRTRECYNQAKYYEIVSVCVCVREMMGVFCFASLVFVFAWLSVHMCSAGRSLSTCRCV